MTCPDACFEGACVACVPGTVDCREKDVVRCRADGSGYDTETTCAENQSCRNGSCADACGLAVDERSNLGCEYFAVDLDNEYSKANFIENDAAGQQFAVVLANPSDARVSVTVYRNDAQPGEVVQEATVATHSIEPRGLVRIDLPVREVDGSSPGVRPPDATDTALTSNAYRVQTDHPVVAYQFNPIIQQFSNDASLLIPVSGLDTHYRVLGFSCSKPIEPPFPVPGLEAGVPDHAYVTIVGIEPDTEVSVELSQAVVGGGPVPATPAGGTVTMQLGRYDVLNLESDGIPCDFTGTVVRSNKPVAVFSGTEGTLAPLNDRQVPAAPGGPPENVCCTDHLEEQVFPTSSWGKRFVVARSPVRSATDWHESDIFRVLADKGGTEVVTSLPAPNDRFTLGQNEWREIAANQSFTVDATEAVAVEQVLVSQSWVQNWKGGHGGDPSMIFYAPIEQYRDDYIFLNADTFSANYVVVALPAGATLTLDGVDVNASDTMSVCEFSDAGMIDGQSWAVAACPVSGGTHRVEASENVGIYVYGYYNVGSYGYAGGSQLTRINLI